MGTPYQTQLPKDWTGQSRPVEACSANAGLVIVSVNNYNYKPGMGRRFCHIDTINANIDVTDHPHLRPCGEVRKSA
jgi:hypothetical protein